MAHPSEPSSLASGPERRALPLGGGLPLLQPPNSEDPRSASFLLETEPHHRRGVGMAGILPTGCAELDETLLASGGFDKGCIVGVTAEDEDLSLLLGLQTIARLVTTLPRESIHGGVPGVHPRVPKAIIITKISASILLPMIQDVVRVQLGAAGSAGAAAGSHEHVKSQVKQCLRHVALSRIFGVAGLFETLSELLGIARSERAKQPASGSSSRKRPIDAVIQDSEDEMEGLSSPEASERGVSAKHAETPNRNEPTGLCGSLHPPEENTTAHKQSHQSEQEPALPEIILVTNMNDIFGELFTQRDTYARYSIIQNLGRELRKCQEAVLGGPLIMLLNTASRTLCTRMPSSAGKAAVAETRGSWATMVHLPYSTYPPGDGFGHRTVPRTLRSIFNPEPLPRDRHPTPQQFSTRRVNYGMFFNRFLDMHLLCTRAPGSRSSAGAVPRPSTAPAAAVGAHPVWRVEVLRDELGSSTRAAGKQGKRKSRERHWTVVEVRNECLIADVSAPVSGSGTRKQGKGNY